MSQHTYTLRVIYPIQDYKMWTTIIGTIGSLFTGWLDHKSAKQKLKQELDLATLKNTTDWESTMANASVTSWKDEYLLIIFSLPLIGMFVSPYVDLIVLLYTNGSYTNGMLSRAATEALTNLGTAPNWYVMVIFTMVGASFGVKKLTEFMNTRGNK